MEPWNLAASERSNHMAVVRGDSLDITTPGGLRLRFNDAEGLRVEGTMGVLLWAGNELSLIPTVADPVKIRLVRGALSFSFLRTDGRQEEVALITGGLAEDDHASLGGDLEFYVRAKNATGDNAMRRVGVLSTAYSPDNLPRVYFLPDLGKFNQRPL